MEQMAAKPPQVRSLPDILTPEEVALLINSTRELRYQVYILTTYSMGLRLGEALNLKVGDIAYMDVGKGREPGAEASMPSNTGYTFAMARAAKTGFCSCKTCIHHIRVDNRYVTLPDFTLYALRKYWSTHRNPLWLFPEGRTIEQRVAAKKPMSRGGSQVSFKKIVLDCKIHKAISIHTLRQCAGTRRCREAHGCARAATATAPI